jgi:hypothetical protein
VRGSIHTVDWRETCTPLTRIAPDDASHRRGDPTSPRKRGEVKRASRTYFAFLVFFFGLAGFFAGFAGFSAFTATGVLAAMRIDLA